MEAIVHYPSMIHHALSPDLTPELCHSHYIPSMKENPYELDSKTAVLLMELNIHLRGFKILKA